MNFKRIEPNGIAAQWVECYWIIESDDKTRHEQKIIPDGFPELIFHFADSYQINISSTWETQAHSLLAGQIRQHFYLRNTGRVSILGIKLKPTSLYSIFQVKMTRMTDKVLSIDDAAISGLEKFSSNIRKADSMDQRVADANNFFTGFDLKIDPIALGVDWIFKNRGTGSVSELRQVMNSSERQVERLFQRAIGLSPKFYSRIIRFNAIFQLLSQGDPSWAELAYEAGYADQSHFIRNFKAFTGEEPSVYGFDEKTLANFFLKKN